MNPETNADIKDIRQILPLTDPIPLALWITLVGLILVIIALAYYLKWRRRKHARKPVAIAPELSPAEWFYQAWQAIAHLKSNTIEYCFRLSFIFREYLERAFKFPATDRTSEEILAELRRREILNNNQIMKMRDLFELIDPIKYAAQLPSPQALEKAEQTIQSFVRGPAR